MIDYYSLCDTKTVADKTGLSQSYIKQLCISNGRVEFFYREQEEYFYARKFGNSWILDFNEFKVFYKMKFGKEVC